MIIKNIKLSTCFVKLLTFFFLWKGVYDIPVYFMHFLCCCDGNIFQQISTCICPLLQRETIAFILSNVKPH